MSDNHELPPLFNGPNFVPLPDDLIATLSEAQAEAYNILADAAKKMVGADEVLAAAQAQVTACIGRVREAEKYLTDNFAKPTFHDLWKQTFKGN